MTSPKLRGGFPAARWVAAALVVLVLFVVSAAAERVYVYEVESDVEIAEDVPHVPGICWRFGEQLLVVWVPRDVAPIRLYDKTYFLLVVPADAQPSQRAEAEAFLKTPDGTYPVVFRKPDGCIIDILAHSIEDALTILKQMGLQPEYRGKAELRTNKTDPLNADEESPAKTVSAFPQVMTPATAAATQTPATTVTQTYVVETTPAWAVIGVLVVLLAVVADLALRRRCTSFSTFFLRVLDWFWIFVPATPATHALFVRIQWVWFISMPALYVYTYLLLGRKLPRAHAGPSERCRDGRGVDTVGLY